MPGVLGAVLLLAGCTDPVPGAGVSTSVAGEVSGAPALPPVAMKTLQAVSASADTKQSVVVIETPVLTAIAAREGYPVPPDDDGAGRVPAEYAYVELSPVQVPCRDLDASFAPLRTGAAGPSITISSTTEGQRGTVSLCEGVADASLLSKNFAGGEGEATTVDGVQGLSANDTFIGIDAAAGATVIRSGTPQSAVVSQVLGGGPVDASLWQDPDVTTVLSQMPGAAVTVFGTGMLSVPRAQAPPAVSDTLAVVVARNGIGQPPVPEFGGYGWIPGDRLVGTSVFVTLYGSDQEAATALSILTGVWTELGASKYSGAVTRQIGSTVVTTVVGTTSAEFALTSGRLAEYPGFLDRG